MLVNWYSLTKFALFFVMPLTILLVLVFNLWWGIILIPLFLISLFAHINNEDMDSTRNNEQAIKDMIELAGIQIDDR